MWPSSGHQALKGQTSVVTVAFEHLRFNRLIFVAHSESFQTSKIEIFVKTSTTWKPVAIWQKKAPSLNIWFLSFDYTSESFIFL